MKNYEEWYYAIPFIIAIVFALGILISEVQQNNLYKEICPQLDAKKVYQDNKCAKIINGEVKYYNIVKLDGYYYLKEIK